MSKPRIIIADEDHSYIVPIQLRFFEEYFEKVDLEIITDAEYFNALFSTPQKVDVLIVSKDLYDSSLRKHNISSIFLMTEQYEEEETGELNVTKIYKYTSIKEIFNEIIGKSNLTVDSDNKKDPQIVLVYSANGGTGKTTVALGMAASLTQNYKRVLYINASWLQTFQRMFDNQSAISSNDIYSRLAMASDNIYDEIKHVFRKELFTYMPPFKASLMSLGLHYSIYEKIAIGARKSNDFDYIIVDADSEFDDEKASLIDVADKVVIVTKQNAASVYSTIALMANINGDITEKFVFLCNDFNADEDNALVSPTSAPKFIISEYINHFTHYDNMKAETLALDNGIKRASFSIL